MTLCDYAIVGGCVVVAVSGLTVVVCELGERMMRWIIRRYGA